MNALRPLAYCLTFLLAGSGVIPSVAQSAVAPSTTRPAAWKGIDVTGHVLEVGGPTSRGTAVVFLSTECPISNRYVPALNELAQQSAADGVPFYGIISDADTPLPAAADWAKKYAVTFPVLFDASGEWARRLNPNRTPEAFVLDPAGQVRYQGRPDDAWATVGRPREVVTHHDLRDAIEAVAAGREVQVPLTHSVGCAFEGWPTDPKESDARPVTWARDVAPIVYANCAECHRPGEVAPFPLVTYDDARKRAKQISEVVADGIMPPWKPAADYGCFLGVRRLSPDQKQLIHRWAETGAQQGPAAEAPPAPTWDTGWRLGKPDLVLKMSEPFEIPAGGRDVYRAFVLPANLAEDHMIVGFEFRPGNPKVVHHCLLFLDDSGQARQLDAADPAPGWRSFGGPGFTPSGGLGGWAPGASPERLPDGFGRPIHKAADVVFQMHYHPDGKLEHDQSQIAIYFAKKPVTKFVGTVPLGRRDIHIPPGDARYTRHQEVTLNEPLTLVGIVPHMHLLGRDMKVTATDPTGRITPLIWIPDWDFQWQGQYRYAQPLTLPAGTRIEMDATYDNSDANPSNPNHPPKEVHFGEQTTDEMCYCFLEVAVHDAKEFKQLRRDIVTQQVMRGLLNRK